MMKETKYRIKEADPERRIEEKDSRASRKEYEQFKEGERAYAKFSQQTGAQDQEFEKDLERMLDEKIAEGLDDASIIDQIMTGGQTTSTHKDIADLEDQKE